MRWCQQTSVNCSQSKSAPSERLKVRAWHSGESVEPTHSLEIADWGGLLRFRPLWPLLDMPVVVVVLVAFSERLLCRVVLG